MWSWLNVKLTKWQVDKMSSWHNGRQKSQVYKVTKCQFEKMASWLNVKLTKYQVDKMPSQQNINLMKWQVDKISSWWFSKLKNLQFDMSSWQNIMLTKL